MPWTCIDTADAIELTEMLQLIAGWLAADPATLAPSLLAPYAAQRWLREQAADPSNEVDHCGWGDHPCRHEPRQAEREVHDAAGRVDAGE